MDTTPDISFYFAVHQGQREDLHRYVEAVTRADESERPHRLRSLAKWSAGFAHVLDEHHYVEDKFFFPDMAAKVPAIVPVLERLDADHRTLDGMLASWPTISRNLADPKVPFPAAQAAAVELGESLRDLLLGHLDIEDHDVLPLYWRHYTAEEYDAVFQHAMKKGKKTGLGFVVPWNVDCIPAGEERDAFVAGAPAPLRLVHRIVRPRYERLNATAFEGIRVA